MWLYFLIFAGIILYFFVQKTVKFADFRQKFVLVTGCDYGLGRQIAMELVRRKIPVFACCLTESAGQSIKSEAQIVDKNAQIWTPIFDVTKDEDAAKTEKFVRDTVGIKGLWSVVCNAGVLGTPAPDDWLSTSDYERSLAVNLIGTIRTCQTFKEHVCTAKGRLVIMSSALGQAAMPYIGPYTVSKFAVEGYADTLRNELAPRGVSVHTVIPGFYSTNLTNSNLIDEKISSCWNGAKDEVKEAYGQEYLENYKTAIISSLVSQCSNDVTAVIDTCVHAITARYPNRRYRVGWDAFGLMILGSVALSLPMIQDLFHKLFYKYYVGVPQLKGTPRRGCKG